MIIKGGECMIIFDVFVNGKKIDELHPRTSSLRELRHFIEEQMNKLQKQYGAQVYLNRRYVYHS